MFYLTKGWCRKWIKMWVIFFILKTCSVQANEILMPKKYGFGSLEWNGVYHEKPEIYLLQESEAYRHLKSGGNINNEYYDEYGGQFSQVGQGVYFNIIIRKKNNNILATLTFTNESEQDYYVHRRHIPSKSHHPLWGPLCSESFLITTGQIKLDYLGKGCQFDINDEENNWVKIPSQEKRTYIVILNHAYEFLPGKHRYNINFLEYILVNNRWFIEQRIVNSMLSVLDRKCVCEHNAKKSTHLLKDYEKNNDYDVRSCSFKSLLNKYGINGGKSKYYFRIRSPQVVMNIDGDKVFSFYEWRGIIMKEMGML
ncbi:hypothetical protein PUATCC27989T_03404 [Phytobacter ursingii]|nr:hypothetical protein PUATCC27989T_03404 [Phytobacter ursingii]